MMNCDQFNVLRNGLVKKLQDIFKHVTRFDQRQLFRFIMKLQDIKLISTVDKYLKTYIANRANHYRNLQYACVRISLCGDFWKLLFIIIIIIIIQPPSSEKH